MAPDRAVLVFTAEHAVNSIPRRYAQFFQRADHMLRSHRGYDPGAKTLARRLAGAFRAPLVEGEVSRLLVDCNRSQHHPRMFSAFMDPADGGVREEILEAYYRPHRKKVFDLISKETNAGRTVVHIGVHTFTPRMNGIVRNADVGLLYDPRRRLERRFADHWRSTLMATDSEVIVRKNYPYRGVADGLTTALRPQFVESRYVGIELEVNQKFFRAGRRGGAIGSVLVKSLALALLGLNSLTLREE